ncbi:MAG: peptidylprolyl isomerase [Acidobacteria bacterium]|nr:peptidylprolyl isomerase [Acidobacteriota bacterium]
MFFKKIFLAALVVVFALHTAIFAQRPAAARPAPRPAPVANSQGGGGISLTPRDMALLVEGLGFPEEVRARLASDGAERKAFAGDIRQMLAVAEEAKAKGLAARPDLALQLELSRAFVISQAYFKRRQDEGASTPEQVVTQAQIDAYVKEPGQDKQFEAFLEDYRKNRPNKDAPISKEQRAELQQHWGRVMVGRRKGVATGVHRERKTELVVMLQQARLLAGAYSKELSPRFKATEAEVGAYISSHPEFDTRESRAKIEALLKRARAGEDFAALAREFSTDPGSRESGGDLGWFGRGVMVKAFEDAAFKLKVGEVSEVFESPFGFHIVKLEERRAQGEAGAGEQVRARHILLRFNSQPRKSGAQPQTPHDEAQSAVEAEKRGRILDEIVARRRVVVPDDYPVELSLTTPAGGGAPAKSIGASAGARGSTMPAAGKAKPRTRAPSAKPKRRPARRSND